MFENINELAVLVSAILAVAVGSIWYSPILFGPVWMRAVGLSITEENVSKKDTFIATVKGVAIHVVLFYIIAQFVVFAKTEEVSLTSIGVFLLIFLATYITSTALWEKKSLSYILINIGYGAISIFGGIGILAYWPW